jgi:glycosyltransferase involved in cell wall biosynthesis
MTNNLRLCLVTRIPGVAGPARFQHRLVTGLAARGIDVCFSLDDHPYDSVLVSGGTRRLAELWRTKKRGVPIIQRLNGINWLHRRIRTAPNHFLRAETNNLLLRIIRDRIATHVVYQSEFAREWWERDFGKTPIPSRVVLNGVPLDFYTSLGTGKRPEDRVRLLVVEGNLAGGYEIGLEAAVGLAKCVADAGLPVELVIAGSAPDKIRKRWDEVVEVPLRWLGLVPPEEIPVLDRSAHLLYASDINPACPNSVIEALACGLPVVAFNTGALPELVTDNAGRLASYGGDSWQLEPPNMDGLAQAALEVLGDRPRFSAGARARAEAAFGLDRMVDGYLSALRWI